MRRTFTWLLLITCFVLINSCKTPYLTADVETQNISVSDSINPLDSAIVRLYLPYKKILEKDMNRVISISEKEMMKGKPESYLTNFLADLLLSEGQKEAKLMVESVKPEISYFNYGGIRSFLPKGDITVGRIFELMPFENEMVFIRLTGKQVSKFLNAVAAKGGDSVGGVRFSIGDKQAKNVFVDGKELDENANYWVVTNDYIAGGGDGLEVFTRRSAFKSSGKKIRDIIISFLEEKQKKGEMITAKLDGRITNE
ncbi:MAG: 5'-nucleotidase C-terminal domain-containing protein [Prolixibacteraceae bacterium]|nr:5'-nucleotidase C-terminal domain-containing protein [Prolixibacteraceae bacterium]